MSEIPGPTGMSQHMRFGLPGDEVSVGPSAIGRRSSAIRSSVRSHRIVRSRCGVPRIWWDDPKVAPREQHYSLLLVPLATQDNKGIELTDLLHVDLASGGSPTKYGWIST